MEPATKIQWQRPRDRVEATARREEEGEREGKVWMQRSCQLTTATQESQVLPEVWGKKVHISA